MYDSVYQQKYKALKNMDDTTSVEELCQLDDRRMITLNFDNILRVYDLDTGKCRLIIITIIIAKNDNDDNYYDDNDNVDFGTYS
jgi:hypothetical protein